MKSLFFLTNPAILGEVGTTLRFLLSINSLANLSKKINDSLLYLLTLNKSFLSEFKFFSFFNAFVAILFLVKGFVINISTKISSSLKVLIAPASLVSK